MSSNNELRAGNTSASNDKTAEFRDLKNLEKISDSYLKELQVKMTDLEERLIEQKFLNGQLQEIKYELLGRISVHHQRSEELGLENFQEMMVQAQNELENDKDESDELACLIFSSCKDMLDDIDTRANTFEEIRNEFKNLPGTNRSSELDTERSGKLLGHMNDLERKIKELESSKKNMSSVLSGLHNADILKDYFDQEMNSADEELSMLQNMKLHVEIRDGVNVMNTL